MTITDNLYHLSLEGRRNSVLHIIETPHRILKKLARKIVLEASKRNNCD